MEQQRKRSNQEMLAVVQFHPFFQGVEHDAALSLIERCEEQVYEKNDIVLHENTPRRGLFLILEGMAEVYVKKDKMGRFEVLEVLQKNELIGFSSLADFLGVARNQPKIEAMVEVRAVEKLTALYIPFDVVTSRWDNPNVHDYLLAQVAIRLQDVYGSLAEQVKLAKRFKEKETSVIRVQEMMAKNIIEVGKEATVQEAAILMSSKRTSSVVVVDNEKVEGIITERDLVNRVLALGLSGQIKVQEVMTKHPHTISKLAYYYDALSILILKGIKHLPVMDEGRIVGMITLSDLMKKKNDSMIKTIQKIEQADRNSLPQVKTAIYDVLETLLQDAVPIFHILDIVTKLYDRLVARAITLSQAELEEEGMMAPVPFTFYQMGSSGRGEQFILTDQDHFIVYANSDEAQEYFSLLGKRIVTMLEIAGYAKCKGLMMSSEDNWRGSLKEWQERLRSWMLLSTNENLLLAQNFFSYRFVYGDDRLHQQFETMIQELLHRSKIFLFRLAQIEREHTIPTLDQPIRSLFKLDRKTIDIKKEILFPFHHSLQILSLLQGIPAGTPLTRIDLLLEKQVFTENFSNDLKSAFAHLIDVYVKKRWHQMLRKEELSTTLFFPRMTTWEKEQLITSLKTMKELQAQMFSYFSI